MYIHENQEWPAFFWDREKIAAKLLQTRYKQGQLLGGMKSIGFQSIKDEVLLQTLTQDVVKTSEIEGEILDPSSVRSSVARRLGIEKGALNKKDRNVDGIVEMMLDATRAHNEPLTKERLFHWHKALFPHGFSGYSKITVGGWRRSSVQVISGRFHNEVIHFEGPNAKKLDQEMDQLIQWLAKETELDPVLKAAIAHFWFVTIHPFEDGNGRIARAIADLLLARSEKSSDRFYSLSAQIQEERRSYYEILEKSQKGSLDITPWLEWFLASLEKAIDKSLANFHDTHRKRAIWKSLAIVSLNDRQKTLINRLLDGFSGKMTTSKWAKIMKCSQDTAYRDISDLVTKGVLVKNEEGGRSTSYSLVVLNKNSCDNRL
jgi:Fic family protein